MARHTATAPGSGVGFKAFTNDPSKCRRCGHTKWAYKMEYTTVFDLSPSAHILGIIGGRQPKDNGHYCDHCGLKANKQNERAIRNSQVFALVTTRERKKV